MHGRELMDCNYEPLKMKKGSPVVFHGIMMRKRGKNKSEKRRIAYSFTVVDERCKCPKDTFVRPLDRQFERF